MIQIRKNISPQVWEKQKKEFEPKNRKIEITIPPLPKKERRNNARTLKESHSSFFFNANKPIINPS